MSETQNPLGEFHTNQNTPDQIAKETAVSNSSASPPQSPPDQDRGHNESGEVNEQNGEAAGEKDATGAALDRTPSQAQKLGKKNIAIVMTALCVCPLPPLLVRLDS